MMRTPEDCLMALAKTLEEQAELTEVVSELRIETTKKIVKSLLSLASTAIPKKPQKCSYCEARLWFVPVHRKDNGLVRWAILDEYGDVHQCLKETQNGPSAP